MNNNNKEKFRKLCRDIIIDEIYNDLNSAIGVDSKLNIQIKNFIKEIEKMKFEFEKEMDSNSYKLSINGMENISDILIKKNFMIKSKIYDIDPEIYYYKNNELYLINYDSIEDKWYLSLLDDDLTLVNEIYSGNYDNFIEYIKNTSV